MSTVTLNAEQMAKRIAELEAQLAAKNAPKAISFKVSEKGGVSVYGLNSRFPVTLYGEQWARLIAAVPQLQAFLNTHKSELSTKANPVSVPATVKA